MEEIRAAFHEAVDGYLELSNESGRSPPKPYSGKIMIRVLLAWEVSGDGGARVRAVKPLDLLEAAGLPAASKVRMKLFTLDNHLMRGTLGHLAEPDERRVRSALTLLLPAG